jgi:hypothetical protein
MSFRLRLAGFGNRGRGGQTMVEFALGLPLLLILFIGMIEVGRAVFIYNVVGNAAREGARFGIMTTGIDPPSTPLADMTWYKLCNRGLDDSKSPGYQEYLGNTSSCEISPNVVHTVIERAAVLDAASTRIQISYDRDAPVPNPTGLEGYNRGVPFTVKVIYRHRPLFAQFIGIPAFFDIIASSTMMTQ